MSHHLRLRTEDLSWRDVDDEIIVLDLQGSEYFAVNGSGAVLWRLLAVGTDEEALRGALVEQFEIDSELARTDVTTFLEELRSLGLVA